MESRSVWSGVGLVEGWDYGGATPGGWGSMEIICILIAVVVTQIHTCLQIHRNVHKKSVLLHANLKNKQNFKK